MLTLEQQKDIDNAISLLAGAIDESEYAFSFSDVDASRKYALLYNRIMLVKKELNDVLKFEGISITPCTKLLDYETNYTRMEISAYRYQETAE